MVSRYEVSKNGVAVLRFRPRPGVLASTAPSKPGTALAKHPFLDAQALDAVAEDELATLLASVSSSAAFIEALEAHGFDVLAL